jgi:hypothetical protein
MKEKTGWKGARYQEKGIKREARKVFNIKVEIIYINSNYVLELFQDNIITEQGLLTCGKLKPKSAELPEFIFRWDEKQDHLNVDMKSCKESKNNWKSEKNGYRGHRTERVRDIPKWAFYLMIKTPSLKVFEGSIIFSLSKNVTIYPPAINIEVHAFAPEVLISPPKIKSP